MEKTIKIFKQYHSHNLEVFEEKVNLLMSEYEVIDVSFEATPHALYVCVVYMA